jgi:hypothetical protein
MSGGVPAYRRGSVPTWQRTDVAAYRRGSVPARQRTDVAAYRRGSVSYPEGVSGLSPGCRLCGTLGYIIESEAL